MDNSHDNIRAVAWSEDKLVLLDQRVLPGQVSFIQYDNVRDIAAAITDMVVRGAPAIGITAAYGIVLAARERFDLSPDDWKQRLQEDLKLLANSRPTAVNLFWAISHMQRIVDEIPEKTDPVPPLLKVACAIHEQDIHANKTMGDYGAGLIQTPCNILTHCNAGALATGGYGTALGVVRSAFKQGKIHRVYADETRPWMQGSRLTAWEMVQENIPVTLLGDGAAAYLMQLGEVDWVIVGSDRIAANGDVANKIGTYSVAVNARRHGVKVMVVAPTTTVDMGIRDGNEIPIEQRPDSEVLQYAGKQVAAAGAAAWNPAFDVTPAELVHAIVTEHGVVEQPNLEKMTAMMENG